MFQVRDQPDASEKVWTAPFIGLTAFLGIYYLSPEYFFPFLDGKPIAKAVAAATFIAAIAQNHSAGRPWLAVTREAKQFSIFAAIMLVGIPFSVWPGGSTEIFTDQIVKVWMLLLLFGNGLQSQRQVSVLIRCIIACGILIAAVSCYHYVIGEVDQDGRLVGYGNKEFRNPNDLSLGLLLMIPAAAAFYSEDRRTAIKMVFAMAIGLMVLVILLSLSRTGMLGLAFLGGLLLLLVGKRNPGKALASCGLLVAVVITVLAASPRIADRAESIFDSEKDDTGSKAERLSHMYDGLNLTLDNPLVGVGLGQSVVAIVAMHDNAAKEWVKIHNAYLLVSTELGLPGLFMFLFMIFSTLGRLRRACVAGLQERILDESGRRIATGLRYSILVFMVAAFFSPVSYNWFLYILMGLSGAILGTLGKPEQAREPVVSGYFRSCPPPATATRG